MSTVSTNNSDLYNSAAVGFAVTNHSRFLFELLKENGIHCET